MMASSPKPASEGLPVRTAAMTAAVPATALHPAEMALTAMARETSRSLVGHGSLSSGPSLGPAADQASRRTEPSLSGVFVRLRGGLGSVPPDRHHVLGAQRFLLLPVGSRRLEQPLGHERGNDG